MDICKNIDGKITGIYRIIREESPKELSKLEQATT